jgi:hypothetical protein
MQYICYLFIDCCGVHVSTITINFTLKTIKCRANFDLSRCETQFNGPCCIATPKFHCRGLPKVNISLY